MPAIRPQPAGEAFCFSCHPGLACFTDCCRSLDLALYPYDVLRLRQALGVDWDTFLDRYAVIETPEGARTPQVFLAMIDDGRASCPFVAPAGCTVYPHRPGACRAYPVGRAVRHDPETGLEEFFVLVREEHCLGFGEPQPVTIPDWLQGQGLGVYNEMNDAFLAARRQPVVQQALAGSPQFGLAMIRILYDLDGLSRSLDGPLGPVLMNGLAPEAQAGLAADPYALLCQATSVLSELARHADRLPSWLAASQARG
ncbi:MAG: YkgJ family cysteine cluster protein [Thermodesulfobacteriota bacterium]